MIPGEGRANCLHYIFRACRTGSRLRLLCASFTRACLWPVSYDQRGGGSVTIWTKRLFLLVALSRRSSLQECTFQPGFPYDAALRFPSPSLKYKLLPVIWQWVMTTVLVLSSGLDVIRLRAYGFRRGNASLRRFQLNDRMDAPEWYSCQVSLASGVFSGKIPCFECALNGTEA